MVTTMKIFPIALALYSLDVSTNYYFAPTDSTSPSKDSTLPGLAWEGLA